MLYQRAVGSCTLRLAVSNTCKELLDWIVSRTGVGYVVPHAKATEKHRQGYTWHTNGDGAESLLDQIQSFLRVKAKQADLGLEFQRRLRTPVLKADYSWQVEWQARMKAMNKRGPREITE